MSEDGRKARDTLLWLRARKVTAVPLAAAIFLIFSYLFFTFVTKEWRVSPVAPQTPTPNDTSTPSPKPLVYNLGCLDDKSDVKASCLLKGSDKHRKKFEDAVAGYWTPDDWRRAVSARGLSLWRVMSGLALVAGLCALFVAGYVIWNAPRFAPSKRKRWKVFLKQFGVVALLFAACVAVFILADHKLYLDGGTTVSHDSTLIVRQYLGYIETQLEGGRLIYYELELLKIGYVTALMLLCASGATLLPYRRRNGRTLTTTGAGVRARSAHLAMQMRHLRILLYAGAVLLALTALRGKTNFDWAMDYLPPLWALDDKTPEWQAATAFHGLLKNLALNNITGVGVMNTLVLSALYVPAALVLQKRAARLANEAARIEKLKAAEAARAVQAAKAAKASEPAEDVKAEGARKEAEPEKKKFDREEWMKSRGLAFPFKEQLTRIAALISPLLAGPVAELLSFVKG